MGTNIPITLRKEMYKALIFDLDGTAIPNEPNGMPTDNLIEVIKQLRGRMKVCVATGRPLFNSLPIIQRLGLTDPCIISGGTQIVDPTTKKILWGKDMEIFQVEAIMKIASQYPYPVFFGDDEVSELAKKKVVKEPERIIYIEPVNREDAEDILAKLNRIPDIAAYKVMSWTPDHFDIHITHAEATKRHALEVLLKILDIHKDNIVTAGDGNNDLPLFEISKYKIAMGNGSDELKKKADFIAPSVTNDGLAIALRKLFLN